MANYNYNEVKIDGIDVGSYLLDWDHDEEWDVAIDMANVIVSSSVSSIITPEVGQLVTIKRGFTSPTEEFVFEGQITQEKPQADRIILICKGLLNEAIKGQRVRSWDKDISDELGIGSEIVKNILDDSSLSYTPAKGVLTDGSIIHTGSSDDDKIVKFIQNDEDNYDRLKELAKRYNYTIRRKPSTGYVYFEPKGYTTYPISLRAGKEIPGQIRWKNNLEQLANWIKINGATVYDKINPTVFTGPSTSFELDKTPEDTEVRDGSSTGSLYVRGQKNIGTIGVDFDYYVDTELKTIVFDSPKSNVWVRYGAQVPMPIIVKNVSSINKYGGPNKTPNKKKFTFNNLKDIKDAEDKGRALLKKYSTPFIEAQNVPVLEDTLFNNGVIEPGMLVNVVDSYNNKDVNVFVKKVRKSMTKPNDEIFIGDEIWRLEDWQNTQMEKINLLFNELNKNEDILISNIDLDRTITYERRYIYKEISSISGDVGIYGNPRLGIYGSSKYGNTAIAKFILGHLTAGILGVRKLGESSSKWDTIVLIQGNNIYKEFVYDEVFYDSTNSTCSYDTTNKKITFTTGQVFISNKIALGTIYNSAQIYFANPSTNNYKVELSGDGGENYQIFPLNIKTNFIAKNKSGVLIKITSIGSLDLENTYNEDNSFDEPAIKIILEE